MYIYIYIYRCRCIYIYMYIDTCIRVHTYDMYIHIHRERERECDKVRDIQHLLCPLCCQEASDDSKRQDKKDQSKHMHIQGTKCEDFANSRPSTVPSTQPAPHSDVFMILQLDSGTPFGF